jgi:hypothetical protein
VRGDALACGKPSLRPSGNFLCTGEDARADGWIQTLAKVMVSVPAASGQTRRKEGAAKKSGRLRHVVDGGGASTAARKFRSNLLCA